MASAMIHQVVPRLSYKMVKIHTMIDTDPREEWEVLAMQ